MCIINIVDLFLELTVTPTKPAKKRKRTDSADTCDPAACPDKKMKTCGHIPATKTTGRIACTFFVLVK